MLKSYLKQDNVAPNPTQLYLVWIWFWRKISFVMSFTISKWLKKYYCIVLMTFPYELGKKVGKCIEGMMTFNICVI